MRVWSEIEDGTATGPSGFITLEDGTASVQVIWDDEKGVQVLMDVADIALTVSDLLALRSLVDALMVTPAPTVQPSP